MLTLRKTILIAGIMATQIFLVDEPSNKCIHGSLKRWIEGSLSDKTTSQDYVSSKNEGSGPKKSKFTHQQNPLFGNVSSAPSIANNLTAPKIQPKDLTEGPLDGEDSDDKFKANLLIYYFKDEESEVLRLLIISRQQEAMEYTKSVVKKYLTKFCTSNYKADIFWIELKKYSSSELISNVETLSSESTSLESQSEASNALKWYFENPNNYTSTKYTMKIDNFCTKHTNPQKRKPISKNKDGEKEDKQKSSDSHYEKVKVLNLSDIVIEIYLETSPTLSDPKSQIKFVEQKNFNKLGLVMKAGASVGSAIEKRLSASIIVDKEVIEWIEKNSKLG